MWKSFSKKVGIIPKPKMELAVKMMPELRCDNSVILHEFK
jgi:hypothetical protein